ncbi:TPA: MFS transporter, partial [Escherichia coli]
MSRTTTVDGAPASDTDKQSISQPNHFIKRGTPQ